MTVPVTIAPSPSTASSWWKDFPWTLIAAIIGSFGAIATALIARRTAEDKRKSDEKIADERNKISEREMDARQAQFEKAEEAKREQFQRAEENKLKQFTDAQDNALRQFEARAAQDKLATARKEIQDQYVDIQNRFTEIDPTMKVSAASRLAEFAERLDPEEKLRYFDQRAKDQNTKPPARIESNYRYFLPVAQQLASALILEEKVAVRNAIRDALKQMSKFAAEEKPEQPLLYRLIEILAEANRRAKNAFIVAFAEWAAAKEKPNLTPEDIDFVAQMTAFCANKENTVSCLHALMLIIDEFDDGYGPKTGTFAYARTVYAAKRLGMLEDERTKADVLLLPRLETAAQQLVNIRDALAFPLSGDRRAVFSKDDPGEKLQKALAAPPDNLSDLKEITGLTTNEAGEFVGWTRPKDLNLSWCFLAGANLRWAQLHGVDFTVAHLQGAILVGTQLQGAHLQGTFFHGANMKDAKLQGADLKWAHLVGAYLGNAWLQGANLTKAHSQGAYLYSAQLQGADLNEAHLEGAKLREAHLEGANLSDAHFQGAVLFMAHLEGADLTGAQLDKANLYGVFVQKILTGTMKPTNFTGSSWDHAIFTPAEIGTYSSHDDSRTAALQEWLKQFPTMPAERVVPFKSEG